MAHRPLEALETLEAAVVPAIVATLGLSRAEAEALAAYMRGDAAELSPGLRAAFMGMVRSRLARRAAECEHRQHDRHGGFKSVYFDRDRVISVAKPQRYAHARAALLEVVIQHVMSARGHNVPRVFAAHVRVAGTPCAAFYQIVAQSERMTCTLAEALHAAAYTALAAEERARVCLIMLSCVCHGLHKLKKELGIRHGDLKPDNIMLRGELAAASSATDVLRRWCLIDFGLTKCSDAAGSDLFFLAWWLVHHYAKSVPPAVRDVLALALLVPHGALGALAPTFVANDKGLVDFAGVATRAPAAPAVATEHEQAWRRQYGVTKHEIYHVQRTVALPAAEPSAFVRLVHRAFSAAPRP